MSARGPQPQPAAAQGEPGAELGYDPGWTQNTWLGAAPEEPPEVDIFWKIAGYARLAAYALATLMLLPLFFVARALGGRLDRVVAGWWCFCGAWFSGLTVRRVGEPMRSGGALLVNHASWLDIMVIGSTAPVHFVSKAEVENWPLFGWIGKISNTVFHRAAPGGGQGAGAAAGRPRPGGPASLPVR